jgi:hypothetical protein
MKMNELINLVKNSTLVSPEERENLLTFLSENPDLPEDNVDEMIEVFKDHNETQESINIEHLKAQTKLLREHKPEQIEAINQLEQGLEYLIKKLYETEEDK